MELNEEALALLNDWASKEPDRDARWQFKQLLYNELIPLFIEHGVRRLKAAQIEKFVEVQRIPIPPSFIRPNSLRTFIGHLLGNYGLKLKSYTDEGATVYILSNDPGACSTINPFPKESCNGTVSFSSGYR